MNVKGVRTGATHAYHCRVRYRREIEVATVAVTELVDGTRVALHGKGEKALSPTT